MNGGVLLIDKPEGPTSHDVVMKVRRFLKTRRVGHAGTLDPMASGLLFLCIGDATRLLEYISGADKTYIGEVVFGASTDTDDAEGTIISTGSIDGLNTTCIQTAVQQLKGEIHQTVPKYSAVHIEGKRAYELARAGHDVTMPSRTVVVESFMVDDFRREGEWLRARFEVRCSKGTYVRALCRDLGQLVGVPAHMGKLRRTQVGSASINDALSLVDLEQSQDPSQCLLEPTVYLNDYPCVDASLAQVERFGRGQRVTFDGEHIPRGELLQDESAIVFVKYNGELAVVAKRVQESDETLLQPVKVFWKKG